MPQLIKPGTVKILTQDGEVQVSIVLELNINLNTNNIDVVSQSIVEKKDNTIKKEKEQDDWMIPDFGDSPKINFGKKE